MSTSDHLVKKREEASLWHVSKNQGGNKVGPRNTDWTDGSPAQAIALYTGCPTGFGAQSALHCLLGFRSLFSVLPRAICLPRPVGQEDQTPEPLRIGLREIDALLGGAERNPRRDGSSAHRQDNPSPAGRSNQPFSDARTKGISS